MPSFMRCCHQNGTCTGSPFDNGFYQACLDSGGHPEILFIPYTPIDICADFVDYGGFIPCNAQRACYHPPPAFATCTVTNLATCLRALLGNFNEAFLTCPPVPFIHVEMFPYRYRAFPYHSNFLAAFKGKDQFGVTVRKLHAFLAYWHGGQAGFDQQELNQPGRLVLERVMGCKDPNTNRQIHAALTQETCAQQHNGVWQWTGRLKSTPAVIINTSTFEDCSKYAGNPFQNVRKLSLVFGFWFPKQRFCTDQTTLELFPQHKTQATCLGAGKYWQTINNIIRPPPWRAAYRSGPGNNATSGQRITTNYNHQGSNEYPWMIYGPVLPLDRLPPTCCTDPTPCVPYCNDPDAPNKFPIFDPRTYEVPNYTRESEQGSGFPYVNNWQLGTGQPRSISAGLRALFGHSPGNATGANLDVYCQHATAGCPAFGVGCEYQFCQDAHENVIRKYRAYSAQRKYEWDADESNRGWWVSYWAEMTAWFVQDSWWIDHMGVRAPQRWATWYTGIVGCRFFGDAENAQFSAWILSHDSGYGIEFGPRYTNNCNDALLKHALLPSALADSFYPSISAQTQCRDPNVPIGGGSFALPPCAHQGLGYSKWYRPEWGAPLPEQTVIHETTRKRFTNAAKTTFQSQNGWAQIGYSTTVPCVIAGPPPP